MLKALTKTLKTQQFTKKKSFKQSLNVTKTKNKLFLENKKLYLKQKNKTQKTITRS